MASLVSGVAKLNPFKKSTREDGDEEKGETVDAGSVAGGGHSSRQSTITKTQLGVSPALRSFLVNQKVLSEQDAGINSDQLTGPLQALVDKPHIEVPPSLIDRSHPLPDYFISSSHNTYLIANQLYGTSDTSAYQTALLAGARCVEIDAWDSTDNKDEPKVTHGYTLVSHISLRKVCETIRDVVDKEAAESDNTPGHTAAPIFISLENHCSAHGQLRMVEIMKEVWGDRLVSKRIRAKGKAEQAGTGDHVRLEELGSKICLIVEYHTTNEKIEHEASSSSEDEESKKARHEYQAQEKAAASAIIPELAELGVYAQSVKPSDSSWFEAATLTNGPHDPLINLSETGLVQHMPKESAKIARNNANHLMRVYPKGSRITSANLKPVPFWNVGAQICALNWQTFGASMQINEALFSGSDGYILKPAALRANGSGKLSTGTTQKLQLHVAGATDVPVPTGRNPDEIKPYISCTLYHPDDLQGKLPKRKTKPYKHHKISDLLHSDSTSSPVTSPLFDEILEWEYESNPLIFLRILLKSDDAFARNPIFAVAAVRLSYTLDNEWRFIRMLDLKGRETRCALLVKFKYD